MKACSLRTRKCCLWPAEKRLVHSINLPAKAQSKGNFRPNREVDELNVSWTRASSCSRPIRHVKWSTTAFSFPECFGNWRQRKQREALWVLSLLSIQKVLESFRYDSSADTVKYGVLNVYTFYTNLNRNHIYVKSYIFDIFDIYIYISKSLFLDAYFD